MHRVEKNAPINLTHMCSGGEQGLHEQLHFPHTSEQTGTAERYQCLPATLCPKFCLNAVPEALH